MRKLGTSRFSLLRVSIGLVFGAVVVVVIWGLAMVWLPSHPPLPTDAASVDQGAPPKITLDQVADALDRHADDPEAAARVRAIANAIRASELAIESVDAIPVEAVVFPAFWVQGDVNMMTIRLVASTPDVREVLLVDRQNQRRTSMRPNDLTLRQLSEGLWTHDYHIYVDKDVSAAVRDAERLLPYFPSDESPLAGSDDQYNALMRSAAHLEIAVGASSIPVVVGRRPRSQTGAN